MCYGAAVNKDHFGALSSGQREAVRIALTATFGSAPISAIAPMTGGATTASVFRIEAGAKRYLLRVEGHPSPLRNSHQYVTMRIAAEAGIAPPLHYVDEAGRVAVMDFVDERPLQTYPGGLRALLQALGDLLRRLQSTRVFPHFVDYPDIVARLFAHVCRTGLFEADLLDPHVERLNRLREAYVSGLGALVSSHNDPNPRNILFDGRRLWLIDWESAYRNDPLVDVSILLDSLAPSPELEEILLHAWLDHAPNEGLRVRLELVRALTRLYYAGVMLSASATAPREKPDDDLSAPSLPEFQLALREGRLRPGAPDTIHVLGKMYLASFLLGSAAPGFDAAFP
jgi:aminoglycoside phosphotransferase (APT) family kinase protein